MTTTIPPSPQLLSADDARVRRICRNLLLALILVGIGLRIAQYLAQPSFWHDEAFLTLNIYNKTAKELLGPLDHLQAAPPVYLLMLRTSYVLFGEGELPLRGVAMLFAVLSLGLMAFTSWRLLPPRLAVLAMALFALADAHIGHSAEVKQYAGDVFVALALLSIALVPRQRSPVTRAVLLSIAAALAVWLAHPTVFVFGGLLLALMYEARGEHRWRAWPIQVASGLLVAASFVAFYFLSAKVQRQPNLIEYWVERGSFPDYGKLWMLPWWLVDNLISLCNYPFEPLGGIVLALGLVGGWWLYRRRDRVTLIALTAPLGLILLAALALQFPFGGSRVTLFTMPLLIFLAVQGVDALAAHRHERVRQAGWVLAGLVVIWIGGLSLVHVAVPRVKSNIRPAVEYARAHWRDGDELFVLGGARDLEFLCYWRQPPPFQTSLTPETLPTDRPFWIVTAFNPKRQLRDVKTEVELAESSAAMTDRFLTRGGAAFRFEPKPNE